MLERRSSEENKHCNKSCFPSCPGTPAGPGPSLTRAVAFKTSKSSRTESFKALLLKKGSRSNSHAGISAVERLCKVASPTNKLQSVLSLGQTQAKPTSSFSSLNGRDVNAPRTLDGPAYCQNTSMSQRALLHAHLLLLPSSSMRLRSLTPPCSGSSRFAAHGRLLAAPMAAIFEGVCDEDNE